MSFLGFIKRRLFLPVLKKISLLVVGYDVTIAKKQVSKLTDNLNKLRQTMDLIVDDPQARWLFKNRLERMDATVGLFDDTRRSFHLVRYEFAARYVSGKIVADIACGTGYGSELLLIKGKTKNVIGIDISIDTIKYARTTHMPDGVQFICAPGDATELPDESIEIVISFETMEHVPDDVKLINEFNRILRPNGTLICSTPNNWPLEFTAHHVRKYDRKSFESVLSIHFDNIVLYNQNSGSNSPLNHGIIAGIHHTLIENEATAECYIAVCKKRKK